MITKPPEGAQQYRAFMTIPNDVLNGMSLDARDALLRHMWLDSLSAAGGDPIWNASARVAPGQPVEVLAAELFGLQVEQIQDENPHQDPDVSWWMRRWRRRRAVITPTLGWVTNTTGFRVTGWAFTSKPGDCFPNCGGFADYAAVPCENPTCSRKPQQHDPTAANCKHWTGDRAGYDLRAVCRACL